MIEEFKDKDSVEAIKQIYYKIFRNRDPFDKPFKEHIENIILLDSCDRTNHELELGFTEPQYNAILNTLEEIGEKVFFLSEIESGEEIYEVIDENIFPRGIPNRYYKITLPEKWRNYLSLMTVIHVAAYSTQGLWGCVFCEAENYALLGGSREFINIFKKHFPGWKDDYCQYRGWYDDYLVTGNKEYAWTKYVVPYVMEKR